jgi:hypothetical protein
MLGVDWGMRAAPCLLFALVLSGCPGQGLNSNVPEVRIVDLDPEHGPVAGGTPVTVTGFGFDGDVAVWFNGTPLPTTRVDSLTLVITTPAGEPGLVDVSVTTVHGEATQEAAFLYTDGATGTATGGTVTGGTTTGAPAPTGLTAGVIQYTLTQTACLSCWAGSNAIDMFAQAAFHDPVNEGWTDWWPALGTCEVNPNVYDPPLSSYWDAGSSVTLSGRTTVPLTPSAALPGTYEAVGLILGDFEIDDWYDLQVAGGFDVPAQTITDVLNTPPGLGYLYPSSLIFTDSGFSTPWSKQSGASITWSTATTGSVLMQAFVMDATGTSIIGDIVCHEMDLGTMTIPENVLAGFPTQSPVGMYFHRVSESFSVIPTSGHTVHGVAQIGVLGTAVITQ